LPDEVAATKIGDHSWFAYAYMDDVDGHRIMFGQEINVP